MYKSHKEENKSEEGIYLCNFRYKIISVLGIGGFSKVYKAKDLKSHIHVAVKKMDFSKKIFRGTQSGKIKTKMKKIIEKEAHILQCLNHINIIKFLDYHADKDNAYLILEYAAGGELFDIIASKGSLSEHDSAFILIQLLRAVDYLHTNGFIHRDIKLENLLLETHNVKSVLKLCDFGISRGMTDIFFTNCGTLDYSAPELIKNKEYLSGYNKMVDNWSIGVSGYIMLCGYCPFYSENGNQNELERQILECDYKFHSPKWDNISKQAKTFISGFLEFDPNNRMSIVDGINSDWIIKNCVFLSNEESVNTNVL